MDLYTHLKELAEKFNVYPRLVEDCIQEMAVAYLSGKTSEKELQQVCIDFGYRTKRFTPSSHFLENVVYVEEEFETHDNTYLLSILAKATEQGIINIHHANYLYQWVLGDADQMIANQHDKKRITVNVQRNNTIKKLREYFEVAL